MNKRNNQIVNQEVKFSDEEQLVSTTDTRGIITYANEAFCHVAGFTPAELIGKNHNIVRHPDMPSAAFHDLWQHIKKEQPWRGAVKNRCKDGRYYWVDAFVTPIYENNKLTGYQSVRTNLKAEYKTNAINIYKKLNDGTKLGSLFDSTNLKHVIFLIISSLILISTFYQPYFSLLFIALPFIVYFQELIESPNFLAKKIISYDSASRYVYSGNNKQAITDFHLQLAEGKISTILGRIIDSTKGLSNEVTKLSQASEASKIGVENETAELHQVSSAVEQMMTTISEVANNTETASNKIEKVNISCQKANEAMDSTCEKVSVLASDVAASAKATIDLTQETEKIGSVMQEIQGIAEQTNLLALNAAIEAARAGEQGRGFSVVADEVRALSNRTQTATEHIQRSVQEIQNTLVSLSETMIKGEENAQVCLTETIEAQVIVQDVYDSISDISDLATQISTAAEEQTMVSAEIAKNVVNISDASQSNLQQALTVEHEVIEINKSIHALNSLGSTFGKN